MSVPASIAYQLGLPLKPPNSMLFRNSGLSDSPPPCFTHNIQRLWHLLNIVDDSTQKFLMDALHTAEREALIQQAIDFQLHNEIQMDLERNPPLVPTDSPFYQMLPPELRYNIFSYLICTPQQVHVFAPKGNPRYGYRLSLCDERTYDWPNGHCRCDSGRDYGATVQSPYLENALFLVSKQVRREALDVFFSRNRFTFTRLYELVHFTDKFRRSSSKITYLRILERVDDYPAHNHRINGVIKARKILGTIKHLDLKIYLSTWSAYDNIYEDGFLSEIIYFAFPPPQSVEVDVTDRSAANRLSGLLHHTPPGPPPSSPRVDRVRQKLLDIFSGKYPNISAVPISRRPPPKLREDEKPLESKKGILFMDD